MTARELDVDDADHQQFQRTRGSENRETGQPSRKGHKYPNRRPLVEIVDDHA
jgi:hypothetical protein